MVGTGHIRNIIEWGEVRLVQDCMLCIHLYVYVSVWERESERESLSHFPIFVLRCWFPMHEKQNPGKNSPGIQLERFLFELQHLGGKMLSVFSPSPSFSVGSAPWSELMRWSRYYTKASTPYFTCSAFVFTINNSESDIWLCEKAEDKIMHIIEWKRQIFSLMWVLWKPQWGQQCIHYKQNFSVNVGGECAIWLRCVSTKFKVSSQDCLRFAKE